jgi:hypothetical protein
MNIQPIIVREYLESLKESEELDYIFPILLEAEGFIIFSKPTEYKGFSQYGKDIVAVGIDFHDGKKKKFHFELKGGDDRHISKSNLTKNDGIIESLRESKYAEFKTLNEEYQKLPLKIVLVHNGEIKASIQKPFEDFIAKEFPLNGDIEFEHWGISELTKLFSEKLFSAFLLTDPKTTKLFNRVLINLDVSEKVSQEFIELLDCMFSQIDRRQYKKTIPRNYIALFESIRLISFIIYTESKSYNNLSIAKKYLSCLILKYWNWILSNKFENDKKITQHFDKTLKLYMEVLNEYFQRTLPISVLKDGLYSEQGGRYEEVGYTCRTFEYLQDLCFFLNFLIVQNADENEKSKMKQIIVNVLNANNVTSRPLLDIQSIPIISILNLFLSTEDNKNAEIYLELVFDNLINAKERYDRMPDANNDIKNVIRYAATKEKSMYYIDTTSLLIATLLEFTVILNREDIFNTVRDFVKKHSIDIAIFVPHHGMDSTSKPLIQNTNFDLEELLFSLEPFNEGYQHNVIMTKNFKDELDFEDYKKLVLSLKNEFTYEYRTDKAGYSFLKDLAHIYNRTPYFPDKWRIFL